MKDLADAKMTQSPHGKREPGVKSDPQAMGRPAASAPPVARRWHVIESRLLDGEAILFVTQKAHLRAARRAHPGHVIYFPPEIDELAAFRTHPDFRDMIRTTHLAKKVFRGWIVPRAPPGGNAG